MTALQPAVKKAKDAGIPVIIIDSKLNGDASQYVSFLATDNKAAGEACAKAMIDLLTKAGKTEGKIQVMSYVAGVGSEIGRVGGFNDYIKANSKFTLLPTQYSNADMPTALNQTTNVLAANPDLIGIFGANEPTAIGMGQRNQAGRTRRQDRGNWLRWQQRPGGLYQRRHSPGDCGSKLLQHGLPGSQDMPMMSPSPGRKFPPMWILDSSW